MSYAQLKSAKVHYTDINPSPSDVSDTVVFVHGLGSSQNFYIPLTYTLKKVNRRFILLDSPGAARSPLPAGDVLTVQSLAATVLELLEHLGVAQNVTIVGHSMGCLVALHIAQLAPEKVVGLVLLGPVYPSAGLAEVFEKRIPAVKKDGMESMAAVVPNAAVGVKASPLTRAFIRELLLGQTVDGYAALCNAIATSTVGDLSKVKQRVLIVAGSEDKSAPMEGSQKYNEEIANAELKVIDGVGHWHVVEAPQEVSTIVDEFLGASTV
ncbi:Alpha/Beta hydrolase protein [Tricharina praecox]|uniref:Alpha/Beta hydrolase protein n=1 Tax=Tricharina praecox TaxID=43433 RepID=UPI00221FDB83|nr:Alpha/Beta hydrolase protein [Tricharina praecox]KAI5854169.1 Alpha/Beta hydrolase protein [Tricharina praecox]